MQKFNTMKPEIKKVFDQYPKAEAVYLDASGKIWLSEGTAKSQSKGGKVETVKRTTKGPTSEAEVKTTQKTK